MQGYLCITCVCVSIAQCSRARLTYLRVYSRCLIGPSPITSPDNLSKPAYLSCHKADCSTTCENAVTRVGTAQYPVSRITPHEPNCKHRRSHFLRPTGFHNRRSEALRGCTDRALTAKIRLPAVFAASYKTKTPQ